MSLQIGQMLYGYCRGVFGREYYCYTDKRIEAIGVDWIVIRYENGKSDGVFEKENLEILESDECTKPQESEDF